MLTDPKEIEIISAARQKNVRDPNRSRQHFLNILRDFFSAIRLDGRYLDMGPGQYDFGVLAKEQGGSCVGLDFDPAVIELGKYKGFDTVHMNIQRLPATPLSEAFDGIFNKFTLNAFWHHDDDEEHSKMIATINAMIKPGGWAWIAPWNGVPKSVTLSPVDVSRILGLQREIFVSHGFTANDLREGESRNYGIHGTVANNVVFTKGAVVWSRRG